MCSFLLNLFVYIHLVINFFISALISFFHSGASRLLNALQETKSCNIFSGLNFPDAKPASNKSIKSSRVIGTIWRGSFVSSFLYQFPILNVSVVLLLIFRAISNENIFLYLVIIIGYFVALVGKTVAVINGNQFHMCFIF